jgi:hypothetical protein
MANRAELLKKIQARKQEKVAAEKAKYAKMRRVAEEAPGVIEKDLTALADACAAQAEAFDALRENLDLIQAPKEASVKVRVAAAKVYAVEFRRIAEQAPEQLAGAISEAYHSLDEQAGALEMLADHLGVELNATPAEEAFAEEGMEEMEEADERGVPMGDVPEPPYEDQEEKEAGSEGWVTDRDESGSPKQPVKVDVPRVANSGPGASGFVTDRNKDGKPTTPQKAEIPQVEGGMAQTSIKDASHKLVVRRRKANETPASAEAFVKDIPQAEGKGQTPANKAGHQRPLTQMTTPAKPAPSAEEFIKEIPQAEGMGQTPGNKKSAAARR